MSENSKVTGRAKGGKAKNDRLSPEERKEQSMKMVAAKKEKAELRQKLPAVIMKRDPLVLADVSIPCAIISGPAGKESEARRVLTSTGISNAILGNRSGASKKISLDSRRHGGVPLPVFLAPGQLKPYIDEKIEHEPLFQPIEYIDGDRIVSGYDARILPLVCDIWLRAREDGALQRQQENKAQKAEILMRALAHVGIIALVDEATGFQYIRPRDELAKIIEAFVAKEMRPYVSKFPPDFYQEIFRLRRLEFPSGTVKRPQYFGHITNDIVYKRLAPGVWQELKEKASKEKRKTKPHMHRFLTEDVGDPRLQKVITQVITIMQLSSNWQDFKQKLDKLVPPYNMSLSLDFDAGDNIDDDGIGL